MVDYKKLFNSKFLEMLDDLIAVFPQDAEFKLFKGTIALALVVNDDSVRSMFKAHLSCNDQFTQSIRNKDEHFFMKHDYNQFQSMDNSDYIIEKLKRCWESLTADNKEVVWKYLTVLLLLTEK